MQRIFEDERRWLASSLTSPFRTVRISPAVASQASYAGPVIRRRLLLAAGELWHRRDNIPMLNRP